jgi:type I restriction enzyme S subunit
MNYGSQRLSLPLGDVLALNREPVRVDPTAEYPNFGLYSFGRGAFEKPPISGTNTSAPTLYRVRAGQFIYSRLFAFEGAFGVVPPRMDGWYVSNEYPTFDVHDWQATVEFIRLVICRPSTWEELAAMTVGMGHRRQRLRPEDLMSFEIDLPPLEEQRAICELNDAAIDACEAIQAERDAATILAASLREHHLLKRAETVPVGELLKGIDSGTSPRCLERPPRSRRVGRAQDELGSTR